MLFIDLRDYYEQVGKCTRLSREEEIECACRMKAGDEEARERLIQSYLPMTASYVRRAPVHVQSFGLALYCLNALEKALDSFNFEQEGETFAHRLSWYLRQAVVRYQLRR